MSLRKKARHSDRANVIEFCPLALIVKQVKKSKEEAHPNAGSVDDLLTIEIVIPYAGKKQQDHKEIR